MSKKLTVAEIAKIYNVTTAGVRYWVSKGLKYDIEKVIGIKPRKVINPKDVDDFLKLTK
jgi:hypothetical protein